MNRKQVADLIVKSRKIADAYVENTRWIKCKTCSTVIDADGDDRFHVFVNPQGEITGTFCGGCRDDYVENFKGGEVEGTYDQG